MTHMRILITGSRSWKDTDAVHAALDEMARAARQSGYSGVTVVHGAAKGADTSAGLWASDRRRRGWPVEAEVHAVTGAEWRRYGNAGHRRNQRMVDLGADVCLAFVNPCESEKCPKEPKPHGTHGTTDCIERCEAEGIRVVPFGPRPPAGA